MALFAELKLVGTVRGSIHSTPRPSGVLVLSGVVSGHMQTSAGVRGTLQVHPLVRGTLKAV
jgi:hypothetical protein